MVAYMQDDVPMAVPISCCHHVSPNIKILLVITRVSSSMTKLIGGNSAFSPLYLVRYFLIVGSPSDGSMFVYIEVASEVNTKVDGGRGGSLFRAIITSVEFLTYAGIDEVKGCRTTSR